jgi:ABC-type oligopeptide transport system ATPase subunit
MLSEILKYHNISDGDASKKRISELLEKVGLKKFISEKNDCKSE